MTNPHNPYALGLDKNPANFVALSPLSFIARAAAVYHDRLAICYGEHRQTWLQTYTRCRRLASALVREGIMVGDTVSVMLPNVPAMFEAHFAVPMSGAVLNTLNTRLDANSIAFMLQHCGAKILITDREFANVVRGAITKFSNSSHSEANIKIIEVVDAAAPADDFCDLRFADISYEDFLAQGDPEYAWQLPNDEWDAIALNYTSGTTGDPKGVVTHHRGAYLNAVSNVVSWQLPQYPVYLWTLPMFHCNGWCFPWTLALNAGTSICLRRVDPLLIFQLIDQYQVTHMCGAPIVYSMLTNAAADKRQSLRQRVQGLIAGAAPPPAVIAACEKINIRLTHVYGLTETYGPAAVCAKQSHWTELQDEEQARLNGRQGVSYPLQESVTVLDPSTMQPVPHDGQTIGEVFFRGNLVMKGYLKNSEATAKAFAGGWFHTGDLAVVYPDGYIKIKDRSKDIIISGGENISSIEVEDILYSHPMVLSAAVVAMPDPKWGEVPCAFVELKPGVNASEAQIITHCRDFLPGFKIPKKIIFTVLPKTSTGKIQKYVLRATVGSHNAINL